MTTKPLIVSKIHWFANEHQRCICHLYLVWSQCDFITKVIGYMLNCPLKWPSKLLNCIIKTKTGVKLE